MNHTLRLFIAVVFFMACGPAEKQNPQNIAPVTVQYTLTPGFGLEAWTIGVAYRWNKARGCLEGTDCELLVGEGGVPVEYVPTIPYNDGHDGMANGMIQPKGAKRPGGDWRFIHIREGVSDPERTLMHEVAHMLGKSEHTGTGVSSTPMGVTYEQAIAMEYRTISEETLTAVCSVTTCLEFNPEKPIK